MNKYYPNCKYICSYTILSYGFLIESKGFTELMYYVMQVRNFPEALNKIKEIINTDPATLNKQNNKGWTALMLASTNSNKYSSEETVKILIDAGANLDLQNKDGWTALMLASRCLNRDSSEETVRILAEAGANVNIQNNEGLTALMYTCRYAKKTLSEKRIKILTDAGANPNIQDDQGYTALIHACMFVQEKLSKEIVDMIIKNNANLDIQNKYGETALTVACNYSTEEVVERILNCTYNLEYYDLKLLKKFKNLHNKYIHELIAKNTLLKTSKIILKTCIAKRRNEIMYHPYSMYTLMLNHKFNINSNKLSVETVYNNLTDQEKDYFSISSIQQLTDICL